MEVLRYTAFSADPTGGNPARVVLDATGLDGAQMQRVAAEVRCSVSPLEASSGRVTRHRLNRFGDRTLNRALHTIVNWRMIHGHEPAQHYLTRRRAEQKSDSEIGRCLKRYTARHLFRLMEASTSRD